MKHPRILCLYISIFLVLAASQVLAQSKQPAAADQAVTYQINVAHSGGTFSKGLIPPLEIKWSVNLNATVGYPLIAEGKIFVLTADSTANAIHLYALDPGTGATLWGPVLVPRGSYWWAAAAYDNGTIFVTPDGATNFGSGAMYAYSAATGDLLWSATLAGQYLFNSPPAAANGIVYTAGAGGGGTVYAVSESDGSTLWSAGVANGNNSSPAIGQGGVFASYVCPQVYRFSPKAGHLVWHYSPGCDGGGGNTPGLFNGSLYVRDSIVSTGFNGIIFNATTGAVQGNFNSAFAPAFFNGTGLYTQTNSLIAFNVTDGSTIWSATPPTGDSYSSAPIIVNGIAYIGTSQGKLLGYTIQQGARVVSMSMPASIAAGDYDTYAVPQSGLAAAQGLIVVPASTYVVAVGHK